MVAGVYCLPRLQWMSRRPISSARCVAQAEGPWRDLETLLLLEGIQKFGDNWGEVAAHVGTKSQVGTCAGSPSAAACCAHPLELHLSAGRNVPLPCAFLSAWAHHPFSSVQS